MRIYTSLCECENQSIVEKRTIVSAVLTWIRVQIKKFWRLALSIWQLYFPHIPLRNNLLKRSIKLIIHLFNLREFMVYVTTLVNFSWIWIATCYAVCVYRVPYNLKFRSRYLGAHNMSLCVSSATSCGILLDWCTMSDRYWPWFADAVVMVSIFEVQ